MFWGLYRIANGRNKLGVTDGENLILHLMCILLYQAEDGKAGFVVRLTTRTLDQHIAQLRKKIEPDPASPPSSCSLYMASVPNFYRQKNLKLRHGLNGLY